MSFKTSDCKFHSLFDDINLPVRTSSDFFIIDPNTPLLQLMDHSYLPIYVDERGFYGEKGILRTGSFKEPFLDEYNYIFAGTPGIGKSVTSFFIAKMRSIPYLHFKLQHFCGKFLELFPSECDYEITRLYCQTYTISSILYHLNDMNHLNKRYKMDVVNNGDDKNMINLLEDLKNEWKEIEVNPNRGKFEKIEYSNNLKKEIKKCRKYLKELKTKFVHFFNEDFFNFLINLDEIQYLSVKGDFKRFNPTKEDGKKENYELKNCFNENLDWSYLVRSKEYFLIFSSEMFETNPNFKKHGRIFLSGTDTLFSGIIRTSSDIKIHQIEDLFCFSRTVQKILNSFLLFDKLPEDEVKYVITELEYCYRGVENFIKYFYIMKKFIKLAEINLEILKEAVDYAYKKWSDVFRGGVINSMNSLLLFDELLIRKFYGMKLVLEYDKRSDIFREIETVVNLGVVTAEREDRKILVKDLSMFHLRFWKENASNSTSNSLMYEKIRAQILEMHHDPIFAKGRLFQNLVFVELSFSRSLLLKYIVKRLESNERFNSLYEIVKVHESFVIENNGEDLYSSDEVFFEDLSSGINGKMRQVRESQETKMADISIANIVELKHKISGKTYFLSIIIEVKFHELENRPQYSATNAEECLKHFENVKNTIEVEKDDNYVYLALFFSPNTQNHSSFFTYQARKGTIVGENIQEVNYYLNSPADSDLFFYIVVEDIQENNFLFDYKKIINQRKDCVNFNLITQERKKKLMKMEHLIQNKMDTSRDDEEEEIEKKRSIYVPRQSYIENYDENKMKDDDEVFEKREIPKDVDMKEKVDSFVKKNYPYLNDVEIDYFNAENNSYTDSPHKKNVIGVLPKKNKDLYEKAFKRKRKQEEEEEERMLKKRKIEEEEEDEDVKMKECPPHNYQSKEGGSLYCTKCGDVKKEDGDEEMDDYITLYFDDKDEDQVEIKIRKNEMKFDLLREKIRKILELDSVDQVIKIKKGGTVIKRDSQVKILTDKDKLTVEYVLSQMNDDDGEK